MSVIINETFESYRKNQREIEKAKTLLKKNGFSVTLKKQKSYGKK
tara:strand:+ start:1048 stop:1182 length:135 start_codon:yes stop_codon:yes gene_type:complete